MLESSRLLFTLAEQFSSQQAYQQAVKCLTPICNESAELPTVKAQARLQLASLLLAHFDNFQEAKTILLAAEQELRQTQGSHLLKCEVWDALARCNLKLGAWTAERDALLAGLKACKQGATSKDKDLLARWRTYFHFKLAEHAMTHEGPEAAAKALAALDASAATQGSPAAAGPAAAPTTPAGVQLTDGECALHLLCRATLHVCAGEVSAASSLVERLNPLLDRVAGSSGKEGSTSTSTSRQLLAKQLRCHYNLLYVSMVVAAGRINDLSQDASGNIAMLAALQKLLSEMRGAPWAYHWLPTPAVGAVGHLLHASLLRSLGKHTAAATYLAAAQEVVEQQLAAHGVRMEGREEELSMRAIWDARIYCHLKVLLLEQQALAALLASRFAAAAEVLRGLTALLDRFPSILREFVPAVQLLLGHYAHSVQQYAAASRHFRAVLQCEAAQPLHDSAALAAALAELHGDEGPGGLRRAQELLQQRGLGELTHVLSLPVHDRTAALVTNALALQRSGDDGNARLMLTKALKAAHSHLGNTQMVAQALNVLAPLQAAKGDLAGAEQMLGSSTTLAKAAGDLPTLVTACRALQPLYSSAPAAAEKAQKHADYTARKAGDLQGVIAAAAALPAHAEVLAWAPPKAQ